jgi:hypothetical protein
VFCGHCPLSPGRSKGARHAYKTISPNHWANASGQIAQIDKRSGSQRAEFPTAKRVRPAAPGSRARALREARSTALDILNPSSFTIGSHFSANPLGVHGSQHALEIREGSLARRVATRHPQPVTTALARHALPNLAVLPQVHFVAVIVRPGCPSSCAGQNTQRPPSA